MKLSRALITARVCLFSTTFVLKDPATWAAMGNSAANLTAKTLWEVNSLVYAYGSNYDPYVTLDGGTLKVGQCWLNPRYMFVLISSLTIRNPKVTPHLDP